MNKERKETFSAFDLAILFVGFLISLFGLVALIHDFKLPTVEDFIKVLYE